jgi:hypothetical protein
MSRSGRIRSGIAAAVRARPGTVVAVAAAVLALDVLLPPVVLTLARAPWTYAAFNPWLKKLPSYLVSDVPLADKVAFLSRVAWFWVSADGPYGAPEWGFAVDTADVLRFLVMAGLIGVYVALVLRGRQRVHAAGGAVGAVASVLALSTGPCSVVGCGAPVLPVVGLVFAGLSSGTLTLLSLGSRVASVIVFAALVLAIGYLGWLTAPPSRPARPPAA